MPHLSDRNNLRGRSYFGGFRGFTAWREGTVERSSSHRSVQEAECMPALVVRPLCRWPGRRAVEIHHHTPTSCQSWQHSPLLVLIFKVSTYSNLDITSQTKILLQINKEYISVFPVHIPSISWITCMWISTHKLKPQQQASKQKHQPWHFLGHSIFLNQGLVPVLTGHWHHMKLVWVWGFLTSISPLTWPRQGPSTAGEWQ